MSERIFTLYDRINGTSEEVVGAKKLSCLIGDIDIPKCHISAMTVHEPDTNKERWLVVEKRK